MITKHDITHAWDVAAASWYAYERAKKACEPKERIRELGAECNRLYRAIDTPTQQARLEFAESRGWKWSKKVLKINRWAPELDHVEFYQRPGETKPRIMVTHSYATRQQLFEWGARHHYKVEVLPWSWHYPPKAIAAVLVPRWPAGVQEFV